MQSAGSSAASDLGADLKARREELGWPLPQIAVWLKIRESHLSALEKGDWASLPGNAYALGFLRTYAQALGIDPDQAVTRFRQDTRGKLESKPHLSFPEPIYDRGSPVGLWVGAGLLALIMAYAGYYHFLTKDKAPLHITPPVAEIMPGVTKRGTPSPQVAAVLPDPGLAPKNLPGMSTIPDAGSPSAAETKIQSGAMALLSEPGDQQRGDDHSREGAQASLAVNTDVEQGEDPSRRGEGLSSNVASKETVAQSTAPHAIILHADAASWVQIRNNKDIVVFEGVLKPGENWSGGEGDAPYRMTFGNAGALKLQSEDVTTMPMGPIGAVRRNVLVSAAAIKSGALDLQIKAGIAAPLPDFAGQPAPSKVLTPPMKKTSRPMNASRNDAESESDRLNKRQLEALAPPR